MGRIAPDREVRHRLHTDYFWPGYVHSVWKFMRLHIRRECRYADPDHLTLLTTAWQAHLSFPKLRIGWRLEFK